MGRTCPCLHPTDDRSPRSISRGHCSWGVLGSRTCTHKHTPTELVFRYNFVRYTQEGIFDNKLCRDYGVQQ